MTRLVRKFWWVLILAGLATLLVVCLVLIVLPPPWMVFRKVVLSPIPASVRQIRADHKWWLNQYSYILRFAISPEDVALLVRSGPFEELAFVRYDRGYFDYGNTRLSSTSINVYAVYNGEREPEWLDLSKWTQCRVYVAEVEGPDMYNVRLLLYDEGRGEAYFVRHEIRGHWGDGHIHDVGIGKEYRKAQEEQEKERYGGLMKEAFQSQPSE
jgi:hypothetical protein